jgi:methyl-accepting chemotaxis protein
MLSKLSIAARLYLLVGMMAVLSIVVGAFGLYGMSGTVAGLKTVYEDRTVPMVQLARIQRLVQRIQIDFYAAIMHAPDGQYAKLHDHPIESHFNSVNESLTGIDQAWKAYMATYLTPEEKALAADAEKRLQDFRDSLVSPTLTSLGKGNFSVEVVRAFLAARRNIGTPTADSIALLVTYQEKLAKEEFQSAVASYERTRAIAVGLIVGGLLAACVLAFAIIQSVTRPLKSMQDAIVRAQAGRDFTQRADDRGRDDVGITARAFNGLMQALQDTFGELRGNVTQLNRSSQELATTAQQAAAGSNDSSEAASSMAAAVEEMTVSVTHLAENARDASALSADSGKRAGEGGRIIQETTTEIQSIASTVDQSAKVIIRLGAQSDKISSVVKVIKEIADQTNLLALNAAIEAARAGEQGRGFAVVADEVRQLAERTAKSTAEISDMIGSIQESTEGAVTSMQGSVKTVEAGVKLAQSAESAMQSIHDGASRVVQVVADMSAALSEQSAAATAIAQQVERVAQGADESSAAARGTADSAKELSALAGNMDRELARFKL